MSIRSTVVDHATGSNLYEHLAGVNDLLLLLLARATFAAAVKRSPDAKLTLRNGARIIEKTWPADDELRGAHAARFFSGTVALEQGQKHLAGLLLLPAHPVSSASASSHMASSTSCIIMVIAVASIDDALSRPLPRRFAAAP